MRTAKTLIRLGGFPIWSEFSLGAHAILLVLSCTCSFYNGHKKENLIRIKTLKDALFKTW